MSCRRLEEIDLLVFLEDGASEVFAEFREHYPTCRECSAGVRAFSELHSGLRGEGAEVVHPSPEILEAYERHALAEPVQANTERHLAICARCRDELRALARFSPTPAQRAAPLPREARHGFRGFLDALGHLAIRPAFAVVLVGLLLLPLIYRARPGHDPDVVAVEDATPTETLTQAPSDPEENMEIATQERALSSADEGSDGARPRSRSSAKLAAPEPSPSAESAGSPQPKSVVADEVSRVPTEARREIAAEFDAKAKRSAPAEASPPPATNAVAQKAEPVAEMEAADARGLSDSDATAAPSAQSEGSGILEGHRWIPTLRLRPGARATAAKKDVAHGVFLDIPLPLRVVDGEARVRVVPDPGFRADLSRDSARSARQAAALDTVPPIERRVPVEEGQRALLIQLPGDSLAAGRYRVELEIMNEGEIAGRGRFRIEVLEE